MLLVGLVGLVLLVGLVPLVILVIRAILVGPGGLDGLVLQVGRVLLE